MATIVSISLADYTSSWWRLVNGPLKWIEGANMLIYILYHSRSCSPANYGRYLVKNFNSVLEFYGYDILPKTCIELQNVVMFTGQKAKSLNNLHFATCRYFGKIYAIEAKEYFSENLIYNISG